MALRCVIVDDSPAVQRAASALLESQGIAVVGVASNSGEALSMMAELEPDVILVDIDLGAESGFDLVRSLAESDKAAGSKTIVISTHDEADYATPIANSPAVGFLPKSDLSATAIRALLDSTPHE
jgi:DNA-binding NarL/FixJ family response regulator